jgi:hypothetical protein
MDVHASSSGLQHVVAYGPHSVVLAHHNHNHNNHQQHFHSLQTRSLPKVTSSYQLVPFIPVAPTTIYVPVEQQRPQQKHHHQQSQGNHFEYINLYLLLFSVIQDPFLTEQYQPSKLFK